ncbi:hypothetical protein DENSPDRAFT_527548 [Dentipellis sp. KUC8613]|nr:hypothetical protein DENSPDRAFT_527548 [Dentipellis sp. KUC8613]
MTWTGGRCRWMPQHASLGAVQEAFEFEAQTFSTAARSPCSHDINIPSPAAAPVSATPYIADTQRNNGKTQQRTYTSQHSHQLHAHPASSIPLTPNTYVPQKHKTRGQPRGYAPIPAPASTPARPGFDARDVAIEYLIWTIIRGGPPDAYAPDPNTTATTNANTNSNPNHTKTLLRPPAPALLLLLPLFFLLLSSLPTHTRTLALALALILVLSCALAWLLTRPPQIIRVPVPIAVPVPVPDDGTAPELVLAPEFLRDVLGGDEDASDIACGRERDDGYDHEPESGVVGSGCGYGYGYGYGDGNNPAAGGLGRVEDEVWRYTGRGGVVL